jgi:hypothetical protein
VVRAMFGRATADCFPSICSKVIHHAGADAQVVLMIVCSVVKCSQQVVGFDQAADAFLTVEPASLRDPAFALACAERAVALNHRQSPSELFILAEDYRAAGQIDQSRAAAEEGLALLSPLGPGSVKPNIRKLLEIQTRPAR